MSYANARALALRLIAKKGRRDGVLRRPRADASAPSGSPWAPEDTDPASDPQVAAGFSVVVLDASLFRPEQLQLTPGTSAVAFVAAQGMVEPHLGDLLETRGARYAVLDVQDLAPGEESVLYTLMLKA